MLNRIKNLFKEESGKEVADKLENLGYFWYTSPAEIGLLKKEISITYKEYGMLTSIYAVEKGKHYPKDYRLYSLNNEVLSENKAPSYLSTKNSPGYPLASASIVYRKKEKVL